MSTHPSAVGGGPATPVTDARRARLIDDLVLDGTLKTPRVIAAMRAVPRHAFLPDTLASEAYADRALPIGHGQTISQPTVVAMMTEALELAPEHRVLEIGTGSGYQAAILSLLCREVFTIEIVAPLAEEASERLERLGYRNVRVRAGDGYGGWPDRAPFDRVVMTAAPPQIPQKLLDQLADPGVLVGPVGDPGWIQALVRVRKLAGKYREERLTSVRFVPMVPGP